MKRINLRHIGDAVVYQISVKAGGSHLVNAHSGEVFSIGRELAEEIAKGNYQSDAPILQIERVDRHSFTYPWGPLPAYRIVFDDERATVSYVSTIDGTVRRTDRWSRVRAGIIALHDFSLFMFVIRREAVRKCLLLLLNMVAIAVVGTGYYLALPRRWTS